MRVQLDVIAAGLAQRLRSSGLVGDDVPPERRIRAGVLVVLSAWAAFVVAGLGLAKTAEHWQAVTPQPDRGVPAAAYDGVLLGAALGTLAVLLGIVLTARPLVAFLRTGGWTKIHRAVLRAFGATGLTASVLVGVIVWAHRLTVEQRNGGDVLYSAAFLVALSLRDRLDRRCGRGPRSSPRSELALSSASLRWETLLAAATTVTMVAMTRVVDDLVGLRGRPVDGAHARPDASDGRRDLACDRRHVPLGSSPALVSVEVCFETHSTSVDNELGIATGWNEGELSEAGRRQAVQLGDRRRHDRIAVVFTSDLRRAVQTAELAFAGTLASDRPGPPTARVQLRRAERHAAQHGSRPSGGCGSTSRSRAARAGGRLSIGSQASCTSCRVRTTASEFSSSVTSRPGGRSIRSRTASLSIRSRRSRSNGARDGSTPCTRGKESTFEP